MAIQLYRFDRAGAAYENGAIPMFADWKYGSTLSGVKNCPCGAYGRRTVYMRSEPDTYFSQPAVIRVKGKIIRGRTYANAKEISFRANHCKSD